MNKAILFLSGQAPTVLPELAGFDKIYCTDRAYFYLYSKGIKPDVISGDFDNFNTLGMEADIEIIETPDQNFTDFEKALQILIQRGFKEVHIYGGSGREQDHFLGNLSVGYKYKAEINLIFFDDYSTYFFIEKETILNSCVGRMISLFPFPFANGIYTEGLQFPLNNESLKMTDRIGIRNTAIDNQIKITFKEGSLLIFIGKSQKEAMV